jgi:hypothetical protein
VLGEPLILGIIGISIYFRFFRGNEGEASDGLADQQANA